MEHPICINVQGFPVLQLSLISHSGDVSMQQRPVLAKPSRIRKRKIYNPLFAKGKWTPKEQLAYINFLQRKSQSMQTSFERKSKKIFLAMSQVIKTRDADQCRSHHQKMIHYRSSISGIVNYYRKESIAMKEDLQGKLKVSLKTQVATQDASNCKEGNGQSTTVVSKGNNVKIWLNSSKILSYTF